MPFEAFIGLRYLRAKRRNGFISFISLISIAGIGLGVAALIIVLSVMNGFQKEVRGRILSVASHLEVASFDGRLQNWQGARNMLLKQPHVQAAAPFVTSQGLFVANGNVRGGLLRGIEPKLENQVVDVGSHMVAGKLDDLRPGGFGMAMGVEMARQLGVGVGDKVTLMTPQGNITPAGMIPRSKQFTVTGIFKVDMFEFDSSLAMVNLRDAQVLERMGDGVSGVRLKLDDPMLAPSVKETLRAQLPQQMVTDWTDTNANYFRAVQIEKRMMTIILTLIVAVAAFNLVSTLVMVVTDKQADIAILRTLGASPASIMKIFMIQGSVAGVLGTLSGAVGGVAIALNLDVIVPIIERIIGAKILSSDVYMIDYLPSDVQWGDVSTITIISLILALLATLYPSWRAARTQPAEALRYE
ncbi:lipoprotein-releasing ABC transporter permease subunit [Chromobacterium sp. IIBBL 290-4]|uniref:lipoprotein-releasing ABC transporter permease subunit n=1 Tax=Chromobacterium sp. IIBBL 290-4 TaxID=2953890 RepID=UPI0020B71FDC|nr:lipoprotein-releasing ABC transporter permease subunit [Chromobacterium sp. IIBBL 290-4]UTH73373.1 lipoprotein-releasing ABC transporter permease subunit [Chromobacterium sp. IIBBL 290-4]